VSLLTQLAGPTGAYCAVGFARAMQPQATFHCTFPGCAKRRPLKSEEALATHARDAHGIPRGALTGQEPPSLRAAPGAKPSAQRKTPKPAAPRGINVWDAARKGDVAGLKQRHVRKQINEPDPNPGAFGKTPLHHAAEGCHLDVVKEILRLNGSVDSGSVFGETALHFAAQGGDAAVVKVLIDAGGDVNSASNHGCLPLHYAAFRGHTAAAAVLLQAGAWMEPIAADGHTPLASAFCRQRDSTARLLIERGAKLALVKLNPLLKPHYVNVPDWAYSLSHLVQKREMCIKAAVAFLGLKRYHRARLFRASVDKGVVLLMARMVLQTAASPVWDLLR
jgi:hypothetical protein